MTRKRLLIAGVIIKLSAISGQAQVSQTGLLGHNEIGTTIHFQSWGKKDDRITQFSMPVLYIWPVNLYTTVDVTTGLAFSQRTTASRSLDGLIDTRVRLTHRTFQERLVLSAFITVPTGNSQLAGDQNEVASALSDDALGFRVPSYGHGVHLNLAAVFAQEIHRGIVIGAGFAYLVKNKFRPFADNEVEYFPGNEMTFTFGFDLGGKKLKLSADASYFIYQADKINEEKVFKSGNKLFLHLRWIYNSAPFGLTIYIRNRSKGKNERGLGLLGAETQNSNGNQLDMGGIGTITVGRKTKLLILGDSKIHAKNKYGDRGALIFSLGGGLQRQVSRRFFYQGSLRFSAGRLRSDDVSETVTGVELSGGIVIRL